MTMRTVFLASVAILAALASEIGQATAKQTDAKHVRVIPYSLDVPIAERLLPDDEVVVVRRHVLSVRNTTVLSPRQVIHHLLTFANAVLIVDVDRVEGVPAEQGRWIQTDMEGAVRETLRHRPEHAFSVDRRIRIGDSNAGELTVGRTLVRTTVSDTGEPLGVVAGARYLMFLVEDPADRSLDYMFAFTINEDETVASTIRPESTASIEFPMNALNGHTLTEIRKWIKRASRKSPA